MQVQQLIQASADVVTITHLRAGDVYKRVESGYSGEVSLRFGVVQSVMNNGEDSAVTAIEYQPDYSAGMTANLKVWDGSKPAALYPATPDEVRSHIDDLRKSAESKVSQARKALGAAEEVLTHVLDIAGQLGALTIPETETPQIEASRG